MPARLRPCGLGRSKGLDVMTEVLKILIVDLSAIFWAIALGSAAKELNAPFERTVERIRKHAKGFDRIVICCDPNGPSFRHKIFPGYKADRKARPEHLWMQLADVKRRLAAEGCVLFESPEVEPGVYAEGDDLCATVAAYCAERVWPCRILTTDSDLAQVVRPGVELQRADTGEVLNAEGVKAWVGVLPAKVVEFKALAGDGDGYKPFPGLATGKPGIGEKGAIMLLERFGSATAAVKAALQEDGGGLKPNARDVLRRGGLDAAAWGLTLAAVRYDIPLDLEQLLQERPAANINSGVAANLIPPQPVADAQWEEEPRAPAAARSADTAPPSSEHRSSAALARVEYGGLAPVGSTSDAAEQLRLLQEFMRMAMVRGVDGDYGPIQGCKKDVLRQSGAQKLAEFYGLAHTFEFITTIEDWEKPLFVYKVKCKLTARRDGRFVGEGVGLCNSRETKYAGRWAYERQIPAHLDRARLKSRTFRDKKNQQVVQYRIPNEEIYDQVNTVLKMACKRAYVAAVISVTRSAGIFTQDLEDMPHEDAGDSEAEFSWAAAG
jgi:5'-3' exonuclease